MRPPQQTGGQHLSPQALPQTTTASVFGSVKRDRGKPETGTPRRSVWEGCLLVFLLKMEENLHETEIIRYSNGRS